MGPRLTPQRFFLPFLLLFFLLGCAERPEAPSSEIDMGVSAACIVFPHSNDWPNPNSHGDCVVKSKSVEACLKCHKQSSDKTEIPATCASCHPLYPHPPDWLQVHPTVVGKEGKGVCATQCHGTDFMGGLSGVSCFSCHAYPHPSDWLTTHGPNAYGALKNGCASANCHNADFKGSPTAPSCFDCHQMKDYPHTDPNWNLGGLTSGHATTFIERTDADTVGDDPTACQNCHGTSYDRVMGDPAHSKCINCHPNFPHPTTWLTTHGPNAYGTLKNGCASANCHKPDFTGNPPTVPSCKDAACHADFPHTDPNWRAGGVGLAANVHASTFIAKIKGGDATACQECHGAGYNRVVPAAPTINCEGCHPGGVTHKTGWVAGSGHGVYFSSTYNSTSTTPCKDCHGHPGLAVTFILGQTKAGLDGLSDCYGCHWAYPHTGYDAPAYDPGVPGVIDADELWTVVDDNILWGPGDNLGHVFYLMNSALLTDSAGNHLLHIDDPNLITPAAPGVIPILQNTCGGSTTNNCHSNGYRTTPTGSTSKLCGKYCHKP